MSDLIQEELIQAALRYHPKGFPVETDEPDQPLHPFQRTPEYQRWLAAWDRAQTWKEWDTLLDEVHAAFPGHEAGDVTQPRMASCLRCCVYVKNPEPDGSHLVTRVVAAVSIVAPVYLLYGTTQKIWFRQRSTPPQIFFDFPGEMKSYASRLAGLIEGVLHYEPFPVSWGDVPLPGIRVSYLKREYPTLLTSLFSDHVENLP